MGSRRRYVPGRLRVVGQDRLSRVLPRQPGLRKCRSFRRGYGVYEEGCGLDNVDMSWGHDEYMYMVCKDYLPEEALYMIRYHSCYPDPSGRRLRYLMNDKDREMFEWVKKFNPYDLYSKGDEKVSVAKTPPVLRGPDPRVLPG